MQFLDNNQFEKALKEIKLKPVSGELRERMLNINQPSKIYPWLAVASIVLITLSLLASSLFKQKSIEEFAEEPVTNPERSEDIASGVKLEKLRYILPTNSQLISINNQPCHATKYIVMECENIEIDGDVMQVLIPTEKQHLIPINIF